MTAMRRPYLPPTRPGILATTFVLLSALVLGTAAPALAGPGSARPVEVVQDVRATAAGVSFRYVPPAPDIEPAPESAGPGRRAIHVAGAGIAPGGPGAWQVPVHATQVLLPEGSDWSLDFTPRTGQRVAGAWFPRVPSTGRIFERGADNAPVDRGDGVTPVSPVTGAVEIFRGRRVLVLTLAPLQFDPTDGSAELYDAIDVTVRFRPASAAGRALAGESAAEAWGDSPWRDLVINPEVDGREPGSPWRAELLPAAGAMAGRPEVYFDDAPTWLKLGVNQNGVYRVTASLLTSAGVTPSSIDPATLRMFAGPGTELSETVDEADVPAWGQPGGFRELSIHVRESGAPNGRFDDADTLLFYGLAVDNFGTTFDPAGTTEWLEHESTGTNIYWLTWGGTFPAPPLRMAVDPSVVDAPVVSTVRERTHVEQNDPSLYDPLPREAGVRWEKWWWQRIEDSGAGYFWDVPLPDIDTTRPLEVKIRWWGSNVPFFYISEPTQSHFLRVSINDQPEVSVRWGGGGQGITRYDMTQSDLPARATNRVVANVTNFPDTPLRVDQILLAWMEFTWWRRLNLGGQRLAFDGSSAAPGPVRFEVAGSEAGVRVFDVTEPWAPRIVPASRIVSGGVASLTFGVADPAGRRYAAVNPGGVLAPASVTRDVPAPRWLRDVEPGVDYLIITADEFELAARDLAGWRIDHLRGITEDPEGGEPVRNARTAVVKVSDIYDEFSGGLPDPMAIRNFLEYAWRNWGPSMPEARLSYVCLLGDANRDTRDREGTGVRNLVPSWQGGYDPLGTQDANPSYASDDLLARFDGPNDRLTDLIVGRIPVSDVENASRIIHDKIIASESHDRIDPNRNRAILVADDVCQAGHDDGLGTEHIRQSERVDNAIPTPLDVEKVYLYDFGQNDCSLLNKPQAKAALIREINAGSWLVNYIGHGGDQVLADEKILETTDVSALTNIDALTVLLAASCSVGKFDRSGSEGLAEALIKWPEGGCVGTIAATHLSFANQNEQLNLSILRHLFPYDDNRSRTLGSGLLLAKLQQTVALGCGTSTTFEFCDTPKKYLLLGDPGSPIVAPERQIRFTDVPDTLERGTLVTVRGEVLAPDSTVDTGYDGAVDLLVRDQPERRLAFRQSGAPPGVPYEIPGAMVYNGRWPVTDGRFEATFVVPVSLRGGARGRLRAFSYGNGVEAVGAVDPLPIGGLSASAPNDTTAPSITIEVSDGRVAAGEDLSVLIEDQSGINLTRLFEFRSIILSFLDETGLERFRGDVTDDFQYDTGSHRKGRVLTRVPDLAAGTYTIRLTATDNFNNRGEARLPVSVGGTGSAGAVSDLLALPNPFDGETTLVFRLEAASPSVRVLVYSVAGRKVREWTVAGVAGENRLAWDGRDAEGDAVANGVYLVKVAAPAADGGDEADVIEPVVRLR